METFIKFGNAVEETLHAAAVHLKIKTIKKPSEHS